MNNVSDREQYTDWCWQALKTIRYARLELDYEVCRLKYSGTEVTRPDEKSFDLESQSFVTKRRLKRLLFYHFTDIMWLNTALYPVG